MTANTWRAFRPGKARWPRPIAISCRAIGIGSCAATSTTPVLPGTANIVRTDAYFRANLHLGVERQDLRIELFAKNVFNDKHWDFAYRNASFAETGTLQKPLPGTNTYTFANGVIVQAPDKREYGVRVNYKF